MRGIILKEGVMLGIHPNLFLIILTFTHFIFAMYTSSMAWLTHYP